jgi:type VI secretion system protein VasG
MSLDTVPEPLTRMKAQLTALEMEKQALLEDIAVGNRATRTPGAIEQEENALSSNSTNWKPSTAGAEAHGTTAGLPPGYLPPERDRGLQQQLGAAGQPAAGADVDARTVATVIADWTGVPLSSLMKDEQTELLSLENNRQTRGGQDAALNAIAQRLRAAKTGLRPRTARRACSCWSARAAPAKPKPRWRWPMCCSAARNPDHHQPVRIPGAAHRRS